MSDLIRQLRNAMRAECDEAADEIERLRAALAAEPSREPVATPMTAERAAYFMRRFQHEEKLLGPNEQEALRFVLEMLESYAAPAAPVVPPGYALVPVEPTPEMVKAGARCASSNMCWREMLAASPGAPTHLPIDLNEYLCGYASLVGGEYRLAGMRTSIEMLKPGPHPIYALPEHFIERMHAALAAAPTPSQTGEQR